MTRSVRLSLDGAFLIVVLVMLLAMAGCASAPSGQAACPPSRPGGDKPQRVGMWVPAMALVLSAYDTDGDGKITRAEAQAGAKADFDRADENHSGFLSELEFQDWAQAALGTREPVPGRLSYDRDFNGEITEQEFVAALMAEFDRMNRTGDGVLTRAQMVDVVEPRGDGGGGEDQPARRQGHGGGHHRGGGGWGGGMGGENGGY